MVGSQQTRPSHALNDNKYLFGVLFKCDFMHFIGWVGACAFKFVPPFYLLWTSTKPQASSAQCEGNALFLPRVIRARYSAARKSPICRLSLQNIAMLPSIKGSHFIIHKQHTIKMKSHSLIVQIYIHELIDILIYEMIYELHIPVIK